MTNLVLFLDDGGVMNDNQVRAPQWQRLVGEFFAPRLGGTIASWGAAHRIVSERLFDPAAWSARMQAAPDYATVDRGYWHDWLGGMCASVGVPAPPEAEGLDLARRASAFVTQRVRAAFPGAVDAIRTLHARNYPLYTASGESSADLAGYLEGMGVRQCFGQLYGPDLIDTFKNGSDYYTKIFADAGVAPADALIVDDTARAVMWAAQAGARTVLVGQAPLADRLTPRIHSLAELPALVEALD